MPQMPKIRMMYPAREIGPYLFEREEEDGKVFLTTTTKNKDMRLREEYIGPVKALIDHIDSLESMLMQAGERINDLEDELDYDFYEGEEY